MLIGFADLRAPFTQSPISHMWLRIVQWLHELNSMFLALTFVLNCPQTLSTLILYFEGNKGYYLFNKAASQ